MRKRKLKKWLQSQYGKPPELHYFPGDMACIRDYYDYRRLREPEAFLLDDISWNDLDLDRLFRRINTGLSTSGEQLLYYQLRCPALDRRDYEERLGLIRLMERRPELRLRIQLCLARLGRSRRADLSRAFSPARHGMGMLLVYGALLLALLAAVLLVALQPDARRVGLLLAMLVVNTGVHEFGKRRSQLDYDTVNYTVNMIRAMARLRRLRDEELDERLRPAYENLDRLRSALRAGGVGVPRDAMGMGEALCTITLLDLITYEFLKNKLGRCHDDVFAVHEQLGRLDAAIAVASYRASLPQYTEPELCFDGGAQAPRALGLRHPLLENAVPNDFAGGQGLLITGSNASGKSTYLKTVALAAVMAQSLGTCLAESYRAPAFRVYSSMALSDDLLAGESYYIVETRSLKRILDAAAEPGAPLLCVIDEVLRGTNTVERIAASCEVLRALAGSGALCLAATHDIELCALLRGVYALYHFEEQVGEDEMLFDYRLRPGEATTRNAIDLLRLLGFDGELVAAAHARADRYLDTGAWS